MLKVGAVDVLVSPESGPTAAFLEVLPFLSLLILTLCCSSFSCSRPSQSQWTPLMAVCSLEEEWSWLPQTGENCFCFVFIK